MLQGTGSEPQATFTLPVSRLITTGLRSRALAAEQPTPGQVRRCSVQPSATVQVPFLVCVWLHNVPGLSGARHSSMRCHAWFPHYIPAQHRCSAKALLPSQGSAICSAAHEQLLCLQEPPARLRRAASESTTGTPGASESPAARGGRPPRARSGTFSGVSSRMWSLPSTFTLAVTGHPHSMFCESSALHVISRCRNVISD